jgi:hypothetical protein
MTAASRRSFEVQMAAPTPLHRDPNADRNDYGCLGRNAAKANSAIANLVSVACDQLNARDFEDGEDLLDFVRAHLKALDKQYDCGSCDTTVKENVFAALGDAMAKAGVEIDQMDLYWW